MTHRVAIIIKALNEERHIGRTLASALAATSGLASQVILADSGSTDATLSIAARYPVDVVQLADPGERSCGIGAQLGYQFAQAEFVYILDGDMELLPGFLEAALARMSQNPRLAGVAGMVEELGNGNYEFEVRKATQDGRITGPQHCLDMGGLYRSEAVQAVGYLTNRNLHSYEEKELGARLLAAGYTLERIDTPSVRHHGKDEQSLALLGKRWRSHHIDGPGEWIRAAMGTPAVWRIALMFKQLWLMVASWVAAALAVALTPWSIWPLALVVALNLALLLRLWRKRGSAAMAWLGFIHLQVYAAGMLRGLCRGQKDARDPVQAVVIQRAGKAM